MSTTTAMPKRHRARWTSTELNNLHNEYEMKELTVQEIAAIHGRTDYAIMSKLQSEGLIDSSWVNARGWVFPSLEQSISLQPAIDDDDGEASECEEQDDPNDEDYVPEEEDDQDDEYEDQDEEHEFDPYNMQQKVTFIEQQIANIYSFLQKNFPKQNVMASST